MLQDVIKDWGGYEVTAMDVYSDIFRLGQGYIQKSGDYGDGKANPLAYYRDTVDGKGHYRVMLEDTFEEVLREVQQAKEFAIINGITYYGRRNIQAQAGQMYAMIFDIDGVNDTCLRNFFSGASAGAYPEPNYVIMSGHGVHLYYIFDEPIDLYPYIKVQLKELKYALTTKMWNRYTSNEEKPQVQGINQGFRVIGSKTKAGAPEPVARAFRYRIDPYSLDELCEYVPEENRVDQQKLWRERKFTLAEAKVKYPQWYQTVVVEQKEWPRTYWQISEKVHGDNPYALYDWWLKQIRYGATYRHRYFAIMCLAIYAIKCQVTYEQLEQDAYGLIPFLTALNPNEPFTEDDCRSALECYDLRYCTFPIKDIEKISDIKIHRNTRNGRTRHEHLQAKYWRNEKGRREVNKCRDNRELALADMREAGEIPGRPSKEHIVQQWRQSHPDGRKIDCHRDTGLSRVTIDKWW